METPKEIVEGEWEYTLHNSDHVAIVRKLAFKPEKLMADTVLLQRLLFKC